MNTTTHTSTDASDFMDALLARASTELMLVLAGLRLLTILPICPDLARDAEARVVTALDLVAEARHHISGAST